jgi:hypothetical protein
MQHCSKLSNLKLYAHTNFVKEHQPENDAGITAYIRDVMDSVSEIYEEQLALRLDFEIVIDRKGSALGETEVYSDMTARVKGQKQNYAAVFTFLGTNTTATNAGGTLLGRPCSKYNFAFIRNQVPNHVFTSWNSAEETDGIKTHLIYLASHEIAHVLGAHHDTLDKGNPSGFIMGTILNYRMKSRAPWFLLRFHRLIK